MQCAEKEFPIMNGPMAVPAMPLMSTSDIRSLERQCYERKRKSRSLVPRSSLRPSTSSFIAVLVVFVASSMSNCSVEAFPLLLNDRARRSVVIQATRAEGTLQPVRPKTAISKKRREEAMKAMNRKKVDSALDGVDAQMLELLSEGFLYPSKPMPPKERPRGRPEYVPGAMTYQTAMKFRERREAMDLVSDSELSAIAAYINPTDQDTKMPESTPRNGATVIPEPRQRKTVADKKNKGQKPKGTASRKKTSPTVPKPANDDSVPKKRKRVVKNLPEPRDRSAKERAPSGRETAKGKKKNNLELQKYYKTELLTAKEEYSLGMKVQFMMKCEEVHEGLAVELLRLPTMEEWAVACGFDEVDPLFVEMEGDQDVRPAGSEEMFHETDPNMFVGNGLAQSAGPGRGRGRAKKPPPTSLKPFFDDSDTGMESSEKGTGQSKRKKPKKPVNQGTPTDFVELMMVGKEAKQRMVQCNMRLVVSIARKYSNVGVSLQDLVQEGSLGLSRAAEKFDPSKGFKFSTYASWWIQQAVFRSIAYHSRTIRLPVHVHNLLNRVRKVRRTLERGLGRPPTNEEMAEELDMTLAKYNKMLRLTKRSISLEVPKYQSNPKDLGHESEDLLGDTVSTGGADMLDETTPEKRVDRSLFHDDLKEMLTILEEDERKVICARYGLADGLTRTVTAVASQMKQSKAWVRSQECRALRKLRRPWYEKKLKEHQNALSS